MYSLFSIFNFCLNFECDEFVYILLFFFYPFDTFTYSYIFCVFSSLNVSIFTYELICFSHPSQYYSLDEEMVLFFLILHLFFNLYYSIIFITMYFYFFTNIFQAFPFNFFFFSRHNIVFF